MSYYTSLSGLNAATTELSVASNNLANVSTTGFKKSRADFGDIVAHSMYQTKDSPGIGTQLRGLDQQFTQGSFEDTGEALNMAISGQGFFVTRNDATGGATSLTRDGSFHADDQGYVVDQSGNFLQGLPVDAAGNATASGMSALSTLRVPQTVGTPTATTKINEAVTLPATADVPANRNAYTGGTYAFSTTDPNSYNYSSSTTVYDANGTASQATTYYVLTKAPSASDPTSTWATHLVVNGAEASGGGSLSFDGSGALTSPTGPLNYTTATGASLAVDYGSATKQAGSTFSLVASNQNGTGLGKLSSVSVDNQGVVSASYSDGTVQNVGRVAVATVINPSGLTETGDNRWQITSASGAATVAGANSEGMGAVRSGQLEVSNVDVTKELVDLIQAQRNFQANAKAIDTANQITETAVNLRN
jgi:flagellar hook protein FlgE